MMNKDQFDALADEIRKERERETEYLIEIIRGAVNPI